MELTLVLIILAFILMVVGILGVFLPFLAGVPVAWLGLLIYSWGTDFERISLTAVLVFLVLTILALIVDFIAPLLGAKKYSASKYGMIGASLGLLLGVAVSGPVGLILGPVFGSFIGELFFAKKEGDAAIKASFGTLIGFVFGVVVKLSVVLVMLGFMIVSLF